MSTQLLILVSMILHMVTFITLALGSIYELKWLTFSSLVSLAVGLFFGKEALFRFDPAEQAEETDEDPPTFV